MNSKNTIIKSLLRTAVDGCILPGTTLGTEILWLYVKEWKKEWSFLTLGILSLIFSQIDLPFNTGSVVNQAMTEQEI